MSMDYNVITPLQNKRRHEGDHEKWNCQSKRLCNGLVGCIQIEYGGVTDSPMDTWEIQQQGLPNGSNANHHVPNMDLAAQGRGPRQCCPRCMAGESGHINHIMGY